MKPDKVIYFPAISCATASFMNADDEKIHKSVNITKSVKFFNKTNSLGMENYLYHPYLLLSAGFYYKVDDVRKEYNIDKDCLIFLDSGGFQLKFGKVNKNTFTRQMVLDWCEKNGDIFPILDHPSPSNNPSKQEYDKALNYTIESAKYYHENRSVAGKKILSVISACSDKQIEQYYNKVSPYKLDGWAHGSSNNSLSSILKLIFFLINKGEFNSDVPINHHIFGISTVKFSYYFELIQREINKIDGVNVQITNDSSSFKRSMSFGMLYTGVDLNAYKSISLVKKYNDTRPKLIPCLSPIFEPELADPDDFFGNPQVYETMVSLSNLWWMLHHKKMVERLTNYGEDAIMFSTMDSVMRHNTREIIKLFADPKNAKNHIDSAIIDIKEISETVQTLHTLF